MSEAPGAAAELRLLPELINAETTVPENGGTARGAAPEAPPPPHLEESGWVIDRALAGLHRRLIDCMLIPAASALGWLHFPPRCFLPVIVSASFLTTRLPREKMSQSR